MLYLRLVKQLHGAPCVNAVRRQFWHDNVYVVEMTVGFSCIHNVDSKQDLFTE